jgi:hypothetical protein
MPRTKVWEDDERLSCLVYVPLLGTVMPLNEAIQLKTFYRILGPAAQRRGSEVSC